MTSLFSPDEKKSDSTADRIGAAAVIPVELSVGVRASLFREILSKSSFLYFLKDVENNFQYADCNDLFASALNVSREEIIGKTDFDFFSVERAERFRESERTAVTADTVITVEEHCDKDDTSAQTYRVVKGVFTVAGHRYLYGMGTDISAEVEKSRKLDSARRLFERILDSFPQPFYVKDVRDGFRYILCNRAFADLVGLNPDQIVGRTDKQLITTDSTCVFALKDEETLVHSGLVCYESTLGTGDQRRVFENRKKTCVTDEGRRLLLGFAEDITEHRKTETRLVNAETDLTAARAAATKAESSKDFFVSHILNRILFTLNTLQGVAELLKIEPKTSVESGKYTCEIIDGFRGLSELLKNVKDFSSGTIEDPLDLSAYNVAELVRGVERFFVDCVEQKKISFEVDVDDMPELTFDVKHVRWILHGLVANAVKFTAVGRVRITARLNHDDTLVCVVADTGVGMTPKQVRERQSVSAAGTSYTVGLPYYTALATRMGGRLQIESVLGTGTTVTLTVPVTPVPKGDAQDEKAVVAADKSAPKDQGETVEGAAAMSALLVDDVGQNLSVLAAMFRRAGLKDIVTVSSGVAAVERLSERDFDFVVTDVWMPRMNGGELVKIMQHVPRWSSIPVYALTADTETMKTDSQAGFTGVLFKPITFERVRALLRDVRRIERRRALSGSDARRTSFFVSYRTDDGELREERVVANDRNDVSARLKQNGAAEIFYIEPNDEDYPDPVRTSWTVFIIPFLVALLVSLFVVALFFWRGGLLMP